MNHYSFKKTFNRNGDSCSANLAGATGGALGLVVRVSDHLDDPVA